jgi:hypothetical protein
MFEFEFDPVTGESGGHLKDGAVLKEWGRHADAAPAADFDAVCKSGSDAVHSDPATSLPPKHVPHILGYHFSMVNDVARATAFKRGLADIITPASIVIDLGSGSGLLAVMAAKLGARHVFAIEQESSLAEASRQVVVDNGVSHCVTVINR